MTALFWVGLAVGFVVGWFAGIAATAYAVAKLHWQASGAEEEYD